MLTYKYSIKLNNTEIHELNQLTNLEYYLY